MEKKKIREMLDQFKEDETPSYFSLKKIGQQEESEIFIDANRNGVLVFCEVLLQSLEHSDVKNEFLKDMPDNFHADDTDVYITHVKVANGSRTPVVEQDSALTQFGCFAAFAAIIIVFLIGLAKSLVLIRELLNKLFQ